MSHRIFKLMTIASMLLVAAVAEVLVNPVTEMVVQTNRHPDLNADSIRIRVAEMSLDRQVIFSVAVRKGTNDLLIDREFIRMTPAQLSNWVNAPNPNTYLRNFILQKVALTEKP